MGFLFKIESSMPQKAFMRLITLGFILISTNFKAELPLLTKRFHQMTAKEIDQLLVTLHEKYSNFQDRLKVIVELRLRTPYEFKALGEGRNGFEPNPVFRIDKTNCTAFVLTSMALASARSYQQAESLMTYLNYHPAPPDQNPISYKNRIHFTSHRLLTSSYFDLITTSVAQPEELDTVRIVLNRQSDGSHFLPIDWEKEVELPYIPKQFINATLLKKLPAICGVGVIQTELFKKGIAIAHEGMIFEGQDFIHASKYSRKVIRERFLKYTRKKKKESNEPVCDGIVLYLMRAVTNK